MKTYGMYIADNGGSLFFQGDPSEQWDDNDVNNLKLVKLSDFDFVNPSNLEVAPNSYAVNSSGPASVSSTASGSADSASVVVLQSHHTNSQPRAK
jgi:hypothetical protein